LSHSSVETVPSGSLVVVIPRILSLSVNAICWLRVFQPPIRHRFRPLHAAPMPLLHRFDGACIPLPPDHSCTHTHGPLGTHAQYRPRAQSRVPVFFPPHVHLIPLCIPLPHAHSLTRPSTIPWALMPSIAPAHPLPPPVCFLPRAPLIYALPFSPLAPMVGVKLLSPSQSFPPSPLWFIHSSLVDGPCPL